MQWESDSERNASIFGHVGCGKWERERERVQHRRIVWFVGDRRSEDEREYPRGDEKRTYDEAWKPVQRKKERNRERDGGGKGKENVRRYYMIWYVFECRWVNVASTSGQCTCMRLFSHMFEHWCPSLAFLSLFVFTSFLRVRLFEFRVSSMRKIKKNFPFSLFLSFFLFPFLPIPFILYFIKCKGVCYFILKNANPPLSSVHTRACTLHACTKLGPSLSLSSWPTT